MYLFFLIYLIIVFILLIVMYAATLRWKQVTPTLKGSTKSLGGPLKLKDTQGIEK